MQRTGVGGGGGEEVLELNCEGLMDKTTGGIIQCFRAWVDARKHAKKFSATLTFKCTTRFEHHGHS